MHLTPWEFTEADEVKFTENRAIIYDSEFIREKSYYPKLALAQVNQAGWEKAKLVDVSEGGCRQFWDQICNHASPIVMHAAAQDLEMIQSVSGKIPKSLRDTQIGFSLLEPHCAISYTDIVQYFLKIKMNKSETRSDWLARPLTASQCGYAADDVGLLLPCYWHLSAALSALGRLHWWQEDSLRFLHQHTKAKSPYAWYKLRGAPQKLRKRHLPLAQLLVNHREMLAEQADLPRRKILSDEAIVGAALAGLSSFEDIQDFFAEDEAFLLETEQLKQAFINIENINIPMRPRPEVLNEENQKLLNQLIAHNQAQADALGIAADTLASQKELRTWVSKKFQNIEKLEGWRAEFFQDYLD